MRQHPRSASSHRMTVAALRLSQISTTIMTTLYAYVTEALQQIARPCRRCSTCSRSSPAPRLKGMLRSIASRTGSARSWGPCNKPLCAAISEACVCSRKRLLCNTRQLATIPGLRRGRCLARRDGYRPLLAYCSATVLFLCRMVNS